MALTFVDTIRTACSVCLNMSTSWNEATIGREFPSSIERETPVVLGCDGQWGLGQVQAHRLLDRMLPKARAAGLAAGTIRNCGHIGRLGEYAERASEAGIILIATVNNGGSGQRVAPPGGIEPRLGTNPLCVAIPTESEGAPILLDFGTSVVAEGKVRAYHVSRQPVPDGWLLDAKGRPTHDPAVLYETPAGSILPLGGRNPTRDLDWP